jgi:hypothetical protein
VDQLLLKQLWAGDFFYLEHSSLCHFVGEAETHFIEIIDGPLRPVRTGDEEERGPPPALEAQHHP